MMLTATNKCILIRIGLTRLVIIPAEAIVFVALTVLILWQMLLPGYILTLDMVWTPDMPLHWNADGFNNGFPVRTVIHALTFIVPSWVVQKLMLFTLFFLLFYLPWRFLPLVEGMFARFFAAALYGLNPFVYSRMLAGQWTVLFGYAFLPLFFHALLGFTDRPNWKSALQFSGALFLISLFSIHFLYLAIVVSGIWVLIFFVIPAKAGIHFLTYTNYNGIQSAGSKIKSGMTKMKVIKWFAIAIAIFFIASLYWLIPAFTRTAPLEGRFDGAHFEAFAASAIDPVPIILNVAALGGFWGEGNTWAYYFAWPQKNPFFWAAFGVIFVIVVFGAYIVIRDPRTRVPGIFFLAIAVMAYITSLGAADTPFRAFNVLLYRHVPLWQGLRDSHKIAGILSLAYAVFAGIGIRTLFSLPSAQRYQSLFPYGMATAFLFPAAFGLYMWGGFQKQLMPVWYPPAWQEAKAALEAAGPEEKVLVLPWHGYFSLDFANQLVVANPAREFFGHDRAVAGRSTEIGGVYDQEVDPSYRKIDELLRRLDGADAANKLQETLSRNRIRYIFLVLNRAGSVLNTPERILTKKGLPEQGVDHSIELTTILPGQTIIEDNTAVFKKITE